MKVVRPLGDGEEPRIFEDSGVGLRCPKCGCRHFRVAYTRPIVGDQIERRKECRHCGHRVTTHELISF